MATQISHDTHAGANGKIWHSDYLELGTGPVPIEPCISPEYFEQEREYVFPSGEQAGVELRWHQSDHEQKDILFCRIKSY